MASSWVKSNENTKLMYRSSVVTCPNSRYHSLGSRVHQTHEDTIDREVCRVKARMVFYRDDDVSWNNFRTSLGVPSNLDYWDTALLQPFNFTVHNLDGFLDKLKLVIKMKFIQRNG
ncbi:hypothetical protein Tco_1364974 [Tanacetum coccineum]